MTWWMNVGSGPGSGALAMTPKCEPPTCVAGVPRRYLCGEHFTIMPPEAETHGTVMLMMRGKCDECGRDYTSADWPIALYRPTVTL
jgi:hypothetical protein